jgi:hypothetical protein
MANEARGEPRRSWLAIASIPHSPFPIPCSGIRLFLLPALLAACAPPPRMCASERDCGAQASCVSGRCVAHGAMPAIASARRLVFAPADVAYVARGEPHDGAVPAVATLGRGDGAFVLLRFAVPISPEAVVLEAYVVLDRAANTDADPEPIALQAARVSSRWDGRSVSWATQPRVEDVGAPVTRVAAGERRLVRLDVRELVHRWRRRPGEDFGVAVLAAAGPASASGVDFALVPLPESAERRDPVLAQAGGAAAQAPTLFEPRGAAPLPGAASARGQAAGPWLELYVK